MFGHLVSEKRKSLGIRLKELSVRTAIDQTLLSRIEQGKRPATEAQLKSLCDALSLDTQSATIEWMTDKVVEMIAYKPYAHEVLMAAESRVAYLSGKHNWQVPNLSNELKELLKQADELRERWTSKRPLDVSHLERLRDYFDVEYTFESNRIEGNTLTLQETALVINEGLTIGGKSVREHLEAINHAEAIKLVHEFVSNKELITKRTVLDIHRLILKGIDDRNAGVYRNVPVRISGSDVELPQPYRLDQLMEDYFEFYLIQRERMHPILLAAEMHERLVSIHPFIDGNGRTSRLVMNLILIQNGYPRVNIKGETASRLEYFRALQTMQQDADPLPFYSLVAREAIRSLESHLEWVL